MGLSYILRGVAPNSISGGATGYGNYLWLELRIRTFKRICLQLKSENFKMSKYCNIVMVKTQNNIKLVNWFVVINYLSLQTAYFISIYS